MYHSFLIHSSAEGHLGCFQCCDEHWGTRVSFTSGFLSVYAQQWDCWVVWQEKYTMFMDRKNQYSENEYTTQSNL